MESFRVEKFLRDESGATAIEYGLIAAAMGLMLIFVMPKIANNTKTVFTNLAGHILSGQ